MVCLDPEQAAKKSSDQLIEWSLQKKEKANDWPVNML